MVRWSVIRLDVCIIGCGSMGTLIAHAIYSATGKPVPCIIRRKKHAEALTKSNLRLYDVINKEYHCTPVIPVHSSLASKEFSCGTVIVTVKSYDLQEALEIASQIASSKDYVGILVNGLAGEKEAKEYGLDPFFIVSDYGVTRISDNEYELRGYGELIVGRDSPLKEDSPECHLADLLSRGGLNSRCTSNISYYRWRKTAANAVINSITSILDTENIIVAENSWARKLAEKVLGEIVDLSKAKNVGLEYDDLSKYVFELANRTGRNISSMLQDLRACKQTEIDSILGVLLEYSRETGINANTIEDLYILVKALEEGRLRCAERKQQSNTS